MQLEILVNGSWTSVSEYIFRSWGGGRRVDGVPRGGPLYYLGRRKVVKRTLQQRFAAALLARGEVEVKRTHRYIVLTSRLREGEAGERFFYLGEAGALRRGRTVSESYPVSGALKKILLDSEK